MPFYLMTNYLTIHTYQTFCQQLRRFKNDIEITIDK